MVATGIIGLNGPEEEQDMKHHTSIWIVNCLIIQSRVVEFWKQYALSSLDLHILSIPTFPLLVLAWRVTWEVKNCRLASVTTPLLTVQLGWNSLWDVQVSFNRRLT